MFHFCEWIGKLIDVTNISDKFLRKTQIFVGFDRSLDGISWKEIDFEAVANIDSLKHVVFKEFNYCTMARSRLRVEVCRPKTDGLLGTLC